MERRMIKGLVASLAFVQSMAMAHAQEIVVDLPDPFASGDLAPASGVQPAPPISPVQSQYTGVVQVTAISRKSGGSLVRIALQQALPLLRLELLVLKSQVKVHEATLLTTSGRRVVVREFKDSDVLSAQTTLVSENLNLSEPVSAVELSAESFQAEADIELKVLSNSGVPRLSVQSATPVQPAVPARSGPLAPPPPPPVRTQEPVRSGPGCLEGVCIGDRAYNIQRNYREVQVVAIERGALTLRFLDGAGTGGGWTRADLALMKGCSEGLCVGASVYRGTRQDTRKAVIVGLQFDGRFVLRFDDNGVVGGNWERSDLAVPYGCVRNLCVGTVAYNIEREFRLVRVVAVDTRDRMVLRFEDNGGVGGNWDPESLALVSGCGRSYCVNNEVFVRARNMRRARVVGIQVKGGYVLNFLDINGIGGNWDDSDLIPAR